MRHAPRHVLQTCVDQVVEVLGDTGWTGGTVNFGEPAVTVDSASPPVGQAAIPDGNTVFVSLGNEPPTEEEELGGRQESVNFPLFVDVFGTTEQVAIAIASDLKEGLRNKIIVVFDYAEQDETEHLIEFQHVLVEIPEVSANIDRRRWRCVKSLAHSIFND